MKTECPRCGEIELDIKVGSGEANCDHCGHYENHTGKYPGFDKFMKDLGGYDEIDKLSTIEAMQIAFLGGRVYESKRDLEALGKIKIQAD